MYPIWQVTRGFILHKENLVPYLINRAYLHKNAAHCLLVKGEKDYIADKDGIIAVIDILLFFGLNRPKIYH
jgi:hypothetical protein